MPVFRFRSVEEMPPAWRQPDDPRNLRIVAQMLALYRRFCGVDAIRTPGVQRFRSIQEANAARRDPYRQEQASSHGS
jgi:hypothetical protein